MRQVQAKWKCEGCNSKWVNTITFEEITGKEAPNERRSDAHTACPKCGRNFAVLGEPGQKITAVETKPAR